MNKITLYLCFFLIFSSTALFSQHPVFEHLTEKDGLPDIEFYGLVEDSKGFIWLAADKGLYRYDGKEFKNYSHPLKKGLSVFGLKFDAKGRLWCNNISGQYFYIENDSLKLFKDFKKYNESGQLGRFFFYNKKLVITCLNKVLETDFVTKKTIDLLPDNFHQLAAYANKDSLFVINYKALLYKLEREKKLKVISNLSLKLKIKSELEMFASSRYKLLNIDYNLTSGYKNDFYLKKGNKFNLLSKKVLDFKFHIVGIYEIDNEIWIYSNKGVFVYEYINQKFILKERYFKDKYVTGILKDKNNNYWFTTHRNGVYVVTNLAVKEYQTFIKSNLVSALEKIDSENVLIAGIEGDLKKINIKTKKIENIPFLGKQKVFKIVKVNNRIITSLKNTGVVFNNQFEKQDYPYLSNHLGNAKSISIVNDSSFVYGGYASAKIFSLEGKQEVLLNNKRTYTTHYNKISKEIYIGYIDNVEYYKEDLKPEKITFKGTSIFALDIDNTIDNTVWIATFKDGVIGVKNGKAICNYTIDNGLLSNQIRLIKADKNELWIVTSKGVQLLDTKNDEIKTLTRKDGINSFDITDIEFFGNDVVFSSNEGVFQFNKHEVFKKTKPSEFYFTKVLINDKVTTLEDEYVLKHDRNKIQFQFHTNGFFSEENIKYRYRLNKEPWQNIDKGIDQVTFNSLSPGNYNFELKSIKTEGEEVSFVRKVKIKVEAPFYMQIWFFILCIITIFIFFVSYLKKVRKKQKEQLEKERIQKQLVTLKLTSLQSQMNPHFIFNALNSIQNLVLKDKKIEAYKYLTKFSSLMRDKLKMSEKNFVYFEEEIEQLQKYLELEKLRFRKDFEYFFIGIEEIDEVKIPSMILQPFVENAIKHGLLHKKAGKKEIILEFYQEKDVLICIIIDNGVGIEKSTKINKQNKNRNTSFSTEAIKDRLTILREFYKTDIGFVYEKKVTGTKVVVKIPYK